MPLLFEQQPRESDKAFAAFSLYLSMGVQRSLAAVGGKLGKSESLIERWSSKYDWQSRVQAYGSHLAKVERQAAEALARLNGVDWAKRQKEHREEEWMLRTELIAAGRKVLEKFKEGNRGATLGDVARALDIASKLGRLASGLATDKTEVTGEDGGPIRVEFEAALKKIYGDVVDVEAVPTALPEKS